MPNFNKTTDVPSGLTTAVDGNPVGSTPALEALVDEVVARMGAPGPAAFVKTVNALNGQTEAVNGHPMGSPAMLEDIVDATIALMGEAGPAAFVKTTDMLSGETVAINGKLFGTALMLDELVDGVVAATALPKRLVVIAGQSNALGLGVASAVTNYPGIADAYPAVQYVERSSVLSDPLSWTTDALRDLSPRTKTVASQVAGTMGVELSMGRTLDAAGTAEWYLAKSAIDGSGLENNWAGAWPTSGGFLAAQFSDWITTQEAATGATLAAIVWIQSEADSTESPDTANYKTNLESFFSALRVTHGDFAVVLNRLSSNYSPGGGRYEVRSLQESWVAEDANAGIVYADDLAFRDTAHFTDDSYVTLGIRLGEKLLDVIDGAAVPANPTWKAAGIPVIATSAQTLTPTWPAHEAGDIGFLILSGLGVNAYTLSTAAGFAAVTGSPQKDTGVSTSARLQVWWCRATSSAMASPVIADAASDDAKVAMIVVVKGAAASGNPWDVTSGDAPAATATAVTFPGVTTTVDNTLVMNILAHRVDAATAQLSGWTNADLTDLTEHVDYDVVTSLGYGIGVATGVKAAAGAVTGTTATLGTTSTQARLTIAIKP